MEEDLKKCKNTIMSCRTYDQLTSAINMNTNFLKKWKLRSKKDKDMLLDMTISFDELNILQKKRLHTIEEYGETLEGDRCMVVTNENEKVWSGTVVDFDDWGKPHQHPLPIIKKDDDNKEYLCMGIVLPYDKERQEKLNNMSYKDRWNSCCREHCKILD